MDTATTLLPKRDSIFSLSTGQIIKMMTNVLLLVNILGSIFSATAELPRNATQASYYLTDNFAGTTFFDNFHFDTYDDPTHGYVNYMDKGPAFDDQLVAFWNNNQQVYMGVDHKNVVSDWARGRNSVRITSNKAFNGNNLIIIDAEHMPTSTGSLPGGCGLWPAFWMVGPDWPTNGEIDIIEYVNNQNIGLTTLHTSNGCSQANEDTSSFTGYWSVAADGWSPATDCSVYAPNQYSNQGCGIYGPSAPVGASFNAGKGGVYATEWVPGQFIRTFFFPRDQIPQDIHDQSPQPDNWGKPYARFELTDSACPSGHFKNNQIVFDTTFCGDWAGATFPQTCTGASSCNDYVKYSPNDFAEAYWLLNYVRVYTRA